MSTPSGKRRLGPFLARNPYAHPYTIGFFFREKMRAIHRVAPDEPLGRVLEIGGGRSGLTALLYPGANVVNVDLDRSHGALAPNRGAGKSFVCADAAELPFEDVSFDAVTAFDVLEHVPDDRRAAAEAWRVLRSGGLLLASAPRGDWRYPYHRGLQPICPHEDDLMREWGHVRRGYSLLDLEALVGRRAESCASFISPATALSHDIAFSRLPETARRILIALVAPITLAGYLRQGPHAPGLETAVAWRKNDEPQGSSAGSDP